ncbi:DNA-directed RNA polymerase subunit omega [Chryseobacterium sp.]|uniref:DNA-directed RNA polymerase subunit omega n=1 Tax=Chryseobacterium sp. TaxID=1871047 RepID=UPI0011CAECE2|nr:DNA-directed RNA polymerase subunit omega [Chryseobacterium sp.]MBW8361804.1 DNA-directed RNA polymerase subunit omega [Kaistella sp.]TXF75888.1 DNA-directed RNA polymerase subunit omega [Chryseobacterium sp.]
MNIKESKAELSTITYDKDKIEEKVDSIYEAIVIMGKRAEQINAEIRSELHGKLDEFAVHNSTLEEVFENREQIEISKHYEKLPKPTSIAIDEFLNDEIYFRKTEEKI